uniref:Uncharacterized protein n=1 Tax=Chlamydomonas euryale TaxID=1486919 RepID=A0A7R9VG35_9CHLO|mmetsp:Transcript_34550/g.102621  ORF Transcript_34550/g.102621 Transcript_34550/m.102621 type:complete len:114 (+) Transcript_34550:226-567(+)
MAPPSLSCGCCEWGWLLRAAADVASGCRCCKRLQMLQAAADVACGAAVASGGMVVRLCRPDGSIQWTVLQDSLVVGSGRTRRPSGKLWCGSVGCGCSHLRLTERGEKRNFAQP